MMGMATKNLQLPLWGFSQNSFLAQQHQALMEISIMMRGHYVLLALLSSAVYCWAVASAVKPGIPRLLACLPVLLVMYSAPLLFHHSLEPITTISATFFACRLTSGKVFAFIMGRGVLVLPLSLPQFVAVMLAPFMPAQLVASKLSLYSNEERNQSTTADSTSGDASNGPYDNSSRHGSCKWQQVTPEQRCSLESSRHSIDGRKRRWSMESSTNSPKAVARHPVHTLLASSGSSSNIPAAQSALGDIHSSSIFKGSSISYFAVFNVLLNVLVVFAFGLYTCSSKQRMVSASVSISGMWVMWRAMEMLMKAASTPAKTFLGMTLAPHFKNPFASSSLTDFWARRWNITQGLVLRFFVYEPIVQGKWVADSAAPGRVAADSAASAENKADSTKSAESTASVTEDSGSSTMVLKHRLGRQQHPASKLQQDCLDCKSVKTKDYTLVDQRAVPILIAPSSSFAPRWRRQLAAAATFVVSGIEHEIFMAYITHTCGWRWFVFFSMQGLLLAIESVLKRRCRRLGLQLHPVVASLAVLLVLGISADAFFWPVLVQPKVVDPLRAALPDSVKELAASLQQSFRMPG